MTEPLPNYDGGFFTAADRRAAKFIFDLPKTWWSRIYEYEWAKQFCAGNDVALDAACGICHPFKFYLADNCRETHCCDLDARILSEREILQDVREAFGQAAGDNFPARYFSAIHYTQASLVALPYADKYFDKIYCLSVLEHLNDDLNKFPLPTVDHPTLSKLKRHEIYDSLKEFKRVLKDDGYMILTFDYPSINLHYLAALAGELGLTFAGKTDFCLPPDAVYCPEWDLYCFRAVIKKKS